MILVEISGSSISTGRNKGLLGPLCSKGSEWLKKEVTKCVWQLFVIMILYKRLNSVQTYY